ncbi:hypothetical protein BJ085DRAFT_32868 [Dimargaris cristalligena]|uniref:Uncharacterized protein n=1 Tax=Dimargaris cristalligena TaxID=215637 RepID=A0A4P9ZMK4_9FUNG|nr:hypothetical protein BJ085DRAFT_32868 [Dimargaris cristalligena]|eukprot:RKP33811.1 hypothetical protein BJ085DRAFT_32868 [Dimargaris cristalligena]
MSDWGSVVDGLIELPKTEAESIELVSLLSSYYSQICELFSLPYAEIHVWCPRALFSYKQLSQQKVVYDFLNPNIPLGAVTRLAKPPCTIPCTQDLHTIAGSAGRLSCPKHPSPLRLGISGTIFYPCGANSFTRFQLIPCYWTRVSPWFIL